MLAETRFWKGGPEEPVSEAAVRGPGKALPKPSRPIYPCCGAPPVFPPETGAFYHGRVSRTDVVIAYLKGIARPEIVEEVRRRLKRIDIDGILRAVISRNSSKTIRAASFP